MRWLAILCLGFVFVPMAKAQRQEPSLVDRLLRPNMELQNSAQRKKFAASSAVVERRGTVGTFYLQPNRTEKSFADPGSYASAQYPSRPFNSGSRPVTSTRNQNANKPAAINTSSVRDVHAAHDANSSVPNRDYAQQRSFNERGKSQKSLDQQNPPMTIDEVRELLNKNK